MRLITATDTAGQARVGALADAAGEQVADTGYTDMVTFVSDGEGALGAARAALEQGRELAVAALGAPVPRPGKMLFLGRTFREFRPGLSDDVEPYVYARVQSSIIGPGEPIRMPEPGATVLYEGELLIVIGAAARRVSAAAAMDHVFGYTQVNDLTWTDWLHREEDGPAQISMCKNADTFCPMGPYLVTADSFDPVDAAFQVTINGQRVLESSTASLVWPVARIVEFLSRTMTLWPGDVIATGTPAAGPIAVGDEVAVEFDGLGRLANPVVAGW